MFTKAVTSVFLFASVIFVGCSGVYYSDHVVGHGKITTLSYDATKRASTLLYKRIDTNLSTNISVLIENEIKRLNKLLAKDDCNQECQNQCDKIIKRIANLNALYYRPVILAENPPQSVKDMGIDIKADGVKQVDLNLSLDAKHKNTFELDSYNLMLRDALYRLNEAMIINEKMSVSDYKEMFKAVLDASSHVAETRSIEQKDSNSSSK